MAEVKNDFLKSKMNKDLDDRLVPQGEYRHAQNITVAKSEGQDVGALENILGNDLISNFELIIPEGLTSNEAVEIIGHYMDVRNDRIIVFMTNYVDASIDTLSNYATAYASCSIGVYDLKTLVSSVIVQGRFLNFSKTHEIYNVDLIDDLLFWTDNRNQPRKINISQALADNTYYDIEDTISVAKYYPHKTIDLVENRVYKVDLTSWTGNPGTGYVVANNVSTYYNGITYGTGLTINITSVNGSGGITGFNVNNPGSGYINNDIIRVTNPTGVAAQLEVFTQQTSTMQDVVSDYVANTSTDNPYRQPYDNTQDITWKGDPEYLKERFVKFSYRFKFDDGEYSLIAPFTQACFVPKQDGYFLENDDIKTSKSTEVDFMQNQINNVGLIINSPGLMGGSINRSNDIARPWSYAIDSMKIKEVDILYKEAGQNVIKIVDTITSDELSLNNTPYLKYDYISSKPWKTLPESEILRVYDQVPVKALTQEIAGNRVIYGNFVDKPTSPQHLNYSLDTKPKSRIESIRYQNQNVKQNRTYQVGIVLSDRYGRQSTVILSTLDKSNISDLVKGSTIFHKFKSTGFSTINNTASGAVSDLFTDTTALSSLFDGDALNITFWDIISSIKSSETGEPGLWGGDGYGSNPSGSFGQDKYNPLGWYSYKIVVKQVEQDYYNVYFPGILNGYIDGDAEGTPATSDDPTCHFVLHADNINKIPRDLTLVSPNQQTFRSGRPSAKDDPSYYQFTRGGEKFAADPKTEEGRRLLKQRDRDRDLNEGSQITNASVKLSLRLNNAIGTNVDVLDNTTHQAYPGTNTDIVTTIGTGKELGLWDASAEMPYNTANVFYGFKNNPYIAKTTTSDWANTGLIGPHPDSGKFNFYVRREASLLDGSTYMPGSLNINCELDLTNTSGTYPFTPNSEQLGGAGAGFQINIDEVDDQLPSDPTPIVTGEPTALSIAYPGSGWNILGPDQGGSWTNPTAPEGILGIIRGAGSATAEFVLHYTKTSYVGKMIGTPRNNRTGALAVYETEPLKSKLDIYWETSTSGLINELNTNILENSPEIPIDIYGALGVNITDVGIGTEETPIASPITKPMVIRNSIGTVLSNDNNVYTLLSVRDGYGNDRTSEFTLQQGVVLFGITFSYMFKINLSTVQVCNWDHSIRENFTFNINVKVPNSTTAWDGLSFINKTLTLGPLPINNIDPSFVLPPDPTIPLTGSINGGLIDTFNAVNGSVIGGGLETEDITFVLTDPSGVFYLDSSANIPGQVKLMNNINGIATTYPITLQVFDGGGLSASYTNTVVLS
jgi:hypothetical protein